MFQSIVVTLVKHRASFASFRGRLCYERAPPSRVTGAPPSHLWTFVPPLNRWIPLLIMSFTGHHSGSKKTDITTSSSASNMSTASSTPLPSSLAHLARYMLLTILFNRLLVSLALGVNSSQFISSSKLSSVLVCQSPRRTPSAHASRRLAFLTAELAIYVRYGFCVPLVTILCEGSSPRVCPSSEVRPKSVSDTLNHVYIHTMLFLLYSPGLSTKSSSNFYSSHFLQLSSYYFSPCTPHFLLVVLGAHSVTLSRFRTPSFRPCTCCVALLSHRHRILLCHQRNVTSYLPSFAGKM